MFNGTVPKLCERFYFNVPYLLKTNSFISDSFKMFTRKKQQQKNPAPSFSSLFLLFTWLCNFVFGQVSFSSACMCLCVCVCVCVSVCVCVNLYIDYLKKFLTDFDETWQDDV